MYVLFSPPLCLLSAIPTSQIVLIAVQTQLTSVLLTEVCFLNMYVKGNFHFRSGYKLFCGSSCVVFPFRLAYEFHFKTYFNPYSRWRMFSFCRDQSVLTEMREFILAHFISCFHFRLKFALNRCMFYIPSHSLFEIDIKV